jgi:hypothetical protein
MQERDSIPQRPTILLVIASVVATAAAAIAAHFVLEWRMSGLRGRDLELHPRTTPREISGIEQTSAIDDGANLDYEPQRKKLTTYGWVDREQGIVHVPIDKAMRELVEQKRR